MKVTHAHFRALNYCNRGARKWLIARGVDWADFLANGVDADWMRATGDAMALKAAELAEAGMGQAEDRKLGGCI